MEFPIKLECYVCKNDFIIVLHRHYKHKMKKYGRVDRCKSCAYKQGAKGRPQNTKEYWENTEIKLRHSKAISESENYQEGISKRDTSGVKNHMYGKLHTEETKAKMVKTHSGSIRPNAKKWQDGHVNLVTSVKGYQHNVLGWYKAVKQRDNFQCKHCESKKNLDSHHIKPIYILVKELLINCELVDPKEQYYWLIEQPEINDTELKNGITLCRKCHKEVHTNWGSHAPSVE